MFRQMRKTPHGWIIRKLTWRGWLYQNIQDPKLLTWLTYQNTPVYQQDSQIALVALLSPEKHKLPPR